VALNYRNLDDRTRPFMVAEIESDAINARLYVSPRLSDQGVNVWPSLLKEAAAFHTDAWLAAEIKSRGLLKTHEERRAPKGGKTVVQIPSNAHETLAEGEFNRFYVRGLCLRAIDENISAMVVYRARHSENPRPESEAIVGRRFAPDALLNDLRTSPGVEPALGVPPGPNSGLSVAIP
jgi:hypothetical protein